MPRSPISENLANVRNIMYAFGGLTKIESLDLSGIKVDNNTNFDYLFNINWNLKYLNIKVKSNADYDDILLKIWQVVFLMIEKIETLEHFF